ncbi:FkbM family methyltransferase [uncultured Winogradskyella sp.]|uniref:FkbM family methyltransferase n=1 Tax=uncultured Winogradskyella sp. TaxID=395353 RepID=UPI003515A1EC
MIRKTVRKVLSTLNKEQKVSLLSKDYVLEEKVPDAQVIDLIKKLRPYNIGKPLIRMGPKRDGGYLVPDDLEGVVACFSPGVNKISEFEMDCYNKGMKIFLADKSVEKPRLSLPETEYSFLKKFIGCYNNEDFITLDKWVENNSMKKKEDLMLQMDIEGAEYMSLLNTSEDLLKSFRIIVLEIHNLHKFWNKEFFKLASTAFDKLLQNHVCVHIHPNNRSRLEVHNGIEIPSVAEITFIRNDRVKEKTPQTTFPHPLDVDNATDREPIVLSELWYAD